MFILSEAVDRRKVPFEKLEKTVKTHFVGVNGDLVSTCDTTCGIEDSGWLKEPDNLFKVFLAYLFGFADFAELNITISPLASEVDEESETVACSGRKFHTYIVWYCEKKGKGNRLFYWFLVFRKLVVYEAQFLYPLAIAKEEYKKSSAGGKRKDFTSKKGEVSPGFGTLYKETAAG